MGYVYRYTDLNDNIIKYVGIVWSDNRSLQQRIMEHSKYDKWCLDKKWKIEYLITDINTRTDAEYFESHYIALYETYKYYNKSKAGWGLSSFLPFRDDWQLFDKEKEDYIESLAKQNEILIQEVDRLNTKIKNNDATNQSTISNKPIINEPLRTAENYDYQILTPIYLENCSLFTSSESRKNKTTNYLVESYPTSRSKFEFRKKLNSSHLSLPCKLLLYRDRKIIDKRYFDSIKECAEYSGLSSWQITSSMKCEENHTYWVWCGRYYMGYTSWPSPWCDNEICIRACAVTPLVR